MLLGLWMSYLFYEPNYASQPCKSKSLCVFCYRWWRLSIELLLRSTALVPMRVVVKLFQLMYVRIRVE
jgi:hypothetical protein